MRRLAPLAVLALLTLLAVWTASPAQASCIASVRWQSTYYLTAPSTLAVPHVAKGKALRGGEIPPCNDTVVNGVPADEPATPVTLRRARNVDARVAVLYRGQLYITVACNDQLAETLPVPTRLPARCGL